MTQCMLRTRNTTYAAVKRSQDLVFSLILLAGMTPYLLYIMARIRLDSPGPVIFTQWRTGLNGRPFRIFKFRTLYHAACDGTGGAQISVNDNRITPLGHKLRANSIDELPQLINILRGDMSLIGPRPHAVDHHNHYAALIPQYSARLRVRPGLTGLAQLAGSRGETPRIGDMRRRVRYDQTYIRLHGPIVDMSILWLSVRRRIWRSKR